MAFVPTGPAVSAGSLEALFGSAAQNSAAIKGAEAFRNAAKAGKFAVDPDQAKKALNYLRVAEVDVRATLQSARELAHEPKIGSSDFAHAARQAYLEGGRSAVEALASTLKVLELYREGIDAAMKNYRRLDDDAAGRFRGSD
ncbi:hypothetical protein [Thermocrispum sp.]|uniref:Uncharacterized protein n=1 Tax=Thermocrispum agreste TaxID=37925 RepID=A0A2W4LIN8_9PSEU|nr:hypothetical protein [Thermocrispum sp.]PZN01020.1 MAG: hypothetical protein DIU77_02020 [Thermocrispum agreste]